MKLNKVLAVAAMTLLVAGCSSSKPEPTATPTPTVTKTQAEIEKEFLKIADDSCTRAQKDDVLERMTNNVPERIIVLSRDHAYKDYSAVYVDNKGVAQVIYELELTVCGPSYLISMQEEAGHDNSGDYEHHIKLNEDGTYSWSEHIPGEAEGVLSTNIFTVEDGYIVASKDEDPAYDRTIEYGPITGEDLQVLKDAVDAELLSLEE
ncbi:MAG: hypothetical protein ACOYJ7_03255 [Rhodoluna sp.]